MKLCIMGRAEDVQQMVGKMVKEKGEKLKMMVYPCPIEKGGARKFYVEVEMKKTIKENQEILK